MATSDLSAKELAAVNYYGPALPFLSKVGGHYVSKQLYDLIRSSIYMILTTPIGTRPWRPEFGSELPRIVFEPDDEILAASVKLYTVEALRRWEPRIRIVRVEVETEKQDNTLWIKLQYLVLATGEQVEQFVSMNRTDNIQVVR
jgi:uncharacterized protein